MNLQFIPNWAEEEERINRMVTDPTLLAMDPDDWRSLAVLGFPRYVAVREGKIYLLSFEGTIEKEVKWHYNGPKKRKIAVSLSYTQKVGKETKRMHKQVTVKHVLAHLFLERPEGSRRVGTKDDNFENLHVDNLYWV